MSFHSWLQHLGSALTPGQRHPRRRGLLRAATHRPRLEVLEDRITPSFVFGGSYPVSPFNESLGTTDYNNDGHLDLYTENSVLLGDGQGGFGAAIDANIGDSLFADFNNDGNVDRAEFNWGRKVVSVMLGNADGAFGLPMDTPILPGLRGKAAADFNGDGNMDLVYSANDDQLLPSTVEVLLGNGQGGFADRHQYDIRTADPRSLAVADLNGDGQLDVVSANGTDKTASVLLGNGDGTLSHDFVSSTFATPQNAFKVAFGDTTSDGIPDLVTASAYSSTGWRLFVQPGRGDGTFGDPIQSVGPIFPWLDWTVADFNGDGQLDVITTSYTNDHGGYAKVSFSQGNGTFYTPTPQVLDYYNVGFDPQEIAIGDFNEDGRQDFAVVSINYNYETGINESNVVVYFNQIVQPPPPEPGLRINNVSITEGHTGTRTATFTVSRVGDIEQTATVDYTTADGTATAGSDYQGTSGTLTFAPGETHRTIDVLINGDRLAEPNETFFVNLSNPTNATIADGQGVGAILDDEPRISISDVTKSEGRRNKKTLFTFTITLSAAYDQAVTVSFRTVDGTAKTSDGDYIAKTGTLTFAPGETTKTITIEVKGDSKREANETFYLDLFGLSSNALFTKNRGLGTILNDD